METATDKQNNNWLTNFLLFILLAGTFAWAQTSLSAYTPHLVVLLILFYLVLHFKYRDHLGTHQFRADVFVAITVVFLLVFTTGSLYSPIFFLIYFLLFGTALLISTGSTYVIAAISALFFLTSLAGEPVRELLQIVSLFFTAPVAHFFAMQYLKNQQAEQKIAFLQEDAQATKEELSENTKKSTAKSKMVAGYSTQLIKKPLTSIWQEIDEMKSFKTLPKTVHSKLDNISGQLQTILKGADKISEETKDASS